MSNQLLMMMMLMLRDMRNEKDDGIRGECDGGVQDCDTACGRRETCMHSCTAVLLTMGNAPPIQPHEAKGWCWC